jgi:hypothetical protein
MNSPIVIGINELDKLPTPTAALALLRDMKGIFEVTGARKHPRPGRAGAVDRAIGQPFREPGGELWRDRDAPGDVEDAELLPVQSGTPQISPRARARWTASSRSWQSSLR